MKLFPPQGTNILAESAIPHPSSIQHNATSRAETRKTRYLARLRGARTPT